MTYFIIFGCFVIAPVLILTFIYNDLVLSRNKVEETYSSIDVMLKKRYDLIPNLIETAKKYMDYENSVLRDITKLRTMATQDTLSDEDKFKVNEQLTSKLHAFNLVVENYPELKASESFDNLQRSLNEVEEQLSASRRNYNAAVKEYNVKIESFPNNIVAAKMNFLKKDFFE
ncbi:MAG: LemA family protein [archaeon]